MTKSKEYKTRVQTEHFYVLSPVPPFVDIILRLAPISPSEFTKVANLAESYPSDPRMVEMVRRAGDASAKVPYLLGAGENSQSILAALREVAQPHVERLKSLPNPMQATIQLLLSVNAVPKGYEAYGLPALLEIDRMQAGIIQTLRSMMADRTLAIDFYDDNQASLRMLDHDWPHLRGQENIQFTHMHPLPVKARMEYQPFFSEGRLAHLHEGCVIVDSPRAQELMHYTPAVLQRPLPEKEPEPTTGSADWLIRDVGKVGRHFTRALLSIINTRLEDSKISLETHNYELINQQARMALREFVEKNP